MAWEGPRTRPRNTEWHRGPLPSLRNRRCNTRSRAGPGRVGSGRAFCDSDEPIRRRLRASSGVTFSFLFAFPFSLRRSSRNRRESEAKESVYTIRPWCALDRSRCAKAGNGFPIRCVLKFNSAHGIHWVNASSRTIQTVLKLEHLTLLQNILRALIIEKKKYS